ncbi:MAG: SP0191 family lipoprotein [Streptococcus sp.]|uniref:SP0191 family lipoprotein n=1 Tax=Streptococcus australis TaxID=113107 RepID=UPI0039C34C78
MTKKLICLGVLLLALTACGQKKHGKTDSSSVQKSNSAKIESFNKENRNLLEKAEEQQVFTKHFVLPKDESGIRQEQTITYKGEQFQKLVMTNTTPVSDELKNAIQEVGLEEAQRLMVESMGKDEKLQQARTLPGFTIELTLPNENEYQTVITYDFTQLDTKKAVELEYFKSANIADLLKLTPTEYMNNLLRNGAKEE